jgi:hypothetical protein
VCFCLANYDALEVKEKIEKVLDISPPLRATPKRDKTTNFAIWSKTLVTTLNREYEIPIGKKKNTVRVPKQILTSNNICFVGGFIRGVFEGDGTAGVYATNRQVAICGGNTQFLAELKKLLRKWNVSTGKIRKMGGCKGFYIKAEGFSAFYHLCYDNHQGLCLERKKRALEEVVYKTPQKYTHSREKRAKISQSLKAYHNRKPSGAQQILTKGFLIDNYFNLGKSAIKIGKEVGCSSTTVYRHMERLGLNRRNQREAKLVGRLAYGNR